MSGGERIVRVIVVGRVQGVGYRAWTQIEAERRKIRGFVRNRLSGDVEAVFAGPAEAVEALCVDCRRGPGLARVDRVDVTEVDTSALEELGAGKGFRQLATI